MLPNAKNQIVGRVKRYEGMINRSVLYIAEAFCSAVVRNCPNVIVCHHHPSGDPTPSPEDVEV